LLSFIILTIYLSFSKLISLGQNFSLEISLGYGSSKNLFWSIKYRLFFVFSFSTLKHISIVLVSIYFTPQRRHIEDIEIK